ncbi:sensor histidine kinase [Desulfuribacillus alkaliarsenatis]|uniref:Oxygen sensor histidine kinase NreB n=1 Tax=Desulfuribacillus alkaliarsenatis TaxID=766136 RepID=A0A1E5G2Y6_9FIRM|nr:sensor histidine kinase [Desulfuribacillus alkaliarsenatis]OEF97436.1 hypothetical protein BHF68_04295 [Desulfuribacillus alkaliarsenatis]
MIVSLKDTLKANWQDVIYKTVPVGFIFGVLFSTVSFFASFGFTNIQLLFLPFLTGVFSGIGAIIALAATNILTEKTTLGKTTIQVLSFVLAATTNTVLVLIIFFNQEIMSIRFEAFFGILFGLGLGAIYAMYSYKVGQMQERMEFLEALAEKNKQLQEASRKLAITDERNRMGRELHDSVSQGLHGLVFTLHSLRNVLQEPNERITSILNHMEATANSTLDELRTMIEELKPSLLAEQGLTKALTVMTDLFSQRHQIPINLDIQTPDNLSAEVELAIYRITQESLTNIERHANAEHISLTLAIENYDTLLLLQISDDGSGFNVEQYTPNSLRQQFPSSHKGKGSGNGLLNIRQRIEETGGTLKIVSKINYGTTIIAKFPL